MRRVLATYSQTCGRATLKLVTPSSLASSATWMLVSLTGLGPPICFSPSNTFPESLISPCVQPPSALYMAVTDAWFHVSTPTMRCHPYTYVNKENILPARLPSLSQGIDKIGDKILFQRACQVEHDVDFAVQHRFIHGSFVIQV